ncbi:MAG: tyrosine-type recombinase/integrase [Thermonemataceae bacterium]|nr:tyrosine-type recombinase/integrase [Thermonemataceae bacterium]
MIEKFLLYISYQKRQSLHTTSSYRNDLEQFVAYLKHQYAIEDPLQADYHLIRSWIISLSEESLKASSINRKIATLKSFYKFLVKQGHLEINPTLRIKSLKTPKKTPIFIEEKELILLFEHLKFEDDFIGLRDKIVLELLYGTGMREAELLGIKEQDINFIRQEIKVLGKGNKERVIPISAALSHILQKYIYEKQKQFQDISTQLILTDEGKPAYPMLIYRIVKKYISLVSNAEKKSPHTLRHSFATHLLNRGADLNAIKEIMGHSSLSATQIYTHNSLQKLKDAFEQAHPKA